MRAAEGNKECQEGFADFESGSQGMTKVVGVFSPLDRAQRLKSVLKA